MPRAAPDETPSAASDDAPDDAIARTIHVIVVRHAEKHAEPASDPPLTPRGSTRAELLAAMLSRARVKQIMTTRTRRTRETVAPLARLLSLEPMIYEPRDAEAIRSQARGLAHDESIVVCGHSNTVPEIVRALGGTIDDLSDEGWLHDNAFDRCFIVSLLLAPAPRAATIEIRLPSV